MAESGQVIAIYTGDSGQALKSHQSATAIAGRGLEGDRYSGKTGTFSKKDRVDQQVTLIEIESIEAMKRDYGVEIAAGDARRNLVTRGVALNHLVGHQFRVGQVVLEGIKLCEPCGHLAKLTSEEVRQALVHRGGLRARIVSGGQISVGDPIRPAPAH